MDSTGTGTVTGMDGAAAPGVRSPDLGARATELASDLGTKVGAELGAELGKELRESALLLGMVLVVIGLVALLASTALLLG